MIRCLCVLLAGCTYITQPYDDPADPLVVELINRSDAPMYLASPVALRFADKGGDVLASVTCADAPCSVAACGFTPCLAAPAVRELLPGEGLLVEWNGLRYERSQIACDAGPVQCVSGARSAKQRYVVTACFARAFRQAGTVLSRGESDPEVIYGAIVDGEECAAAIDVGFPGFDVRHQVELR